jgi:hypothetical protein
MRFEVSERIQTSADSQRLLAAISEQFLKVATKVSRQGDTLEVKAIEASFGSINRRDVTTVELKPKGRRSLGRCLSRLSSVCGLLVGTGAACVAAPSELRGRGRPTTPFSLVSLLPGDYAYPAGGPDSSIVDSRTGVRGWRGGTRRQWAIGAGHLGRGVDIPGDVTAHSRDKYEGQIVPGPKKKDGLSCGNAWELGCRPCLSSVSSDTER